ncbi:hypothetical protein WCE41_13015 [Luteimonas sp. MJ246]|uniref:hypothetical protein n=1 Tax=Luteimonas sp. MJ174 TaxID=3129237 RepID=UPI0031B9CB28
MPLSLSEIRDRARAFAREWDGETSERAEAQSFWNDIRNTPAAWAAVCVSSNI